MSNIDLDNRKVEYKVKAFEGASENNGALAESVWCGFPLGTFAVNAAGSLLIGVVLGAELPPPAVRLLAVGFCGGFTTFSTFSADTLRLLRAGNYGPAAAYAALSIAVCLACTAAGWWFGTLAAKR